MRRKKVQEVARDAGGTVTLGQNRNPRVGSGACLQVCARPVARRVVGHDEMDVHAHLGEHGVNLFVEPRPALGHPVVGGHKDGDSGAKHGLVSGHAIQGLSVLRRRTSPRRLP